LSILAKAHYFWRGVSTGSVNRRIFSAIVVIGAATVLVKAAALVKDMVVAGGFGLSDALDAFLIALAIPAFLTTLVGYSFVGAFVPIYIRVRENEGPNAARGLFSHVIVLNLAILGGLALLLAMAGAPLLKLLAWDFSPEQLELTRRLYLLLLLAAVLDGQVFLWSAVLNAKESFALPAITPMLGPFFVVCALILVPGLDVYALVGGALAGSVAQLSVLGIALARRDLLAAPRWNHASSGSRGVLQHCWPLMLGSVFANGALVVDQAMASWLGPGSVAALNYANKVPAFLCGIGVTALGTAVLPHFSRLVALQKYDALADTLRLYTRWILIVGVPVALLFIISSEWIVKILFERGAFRAADTDLVSFVQQMYFLQVPFMILGMLGARLLVAMERNHHLTIISLIALLLNVAGNLILMRWMGVAGIALATSLGYVASLAMIFAVAHWSLRRNAVRT
jgi:putative peptidoglycan lipid II flippase